MSTNKLRTPTKGSVSGYTMASVFGDASRGEQAMRLTTSNPFAALDAVIEPRSDGSGSSSSPSSSGGSMSQNGYAAGEVALATPPRGFVLGDPPSGRQLLGMNGISPQQMRRMSVNAQNMPAAYTSSAQQRMATAVDYSGSPRKATTPGRLSINTQVSGSPQRVAMGQCRDSNVGQASPTARRGSGRASFSSNLRAPTMLQDPIAAPLTGIPQLLAVQEMAYRQGQHDHGVSRDRLPSSPFAKQFDQVWVQFYVLGKECGGTPISSSNVDPSSGHQNFPWPVLINPYTQDLEHPNGAVDSQWVRKVCTIALNCMAALIGTVCRRQGEWHKTICDVPAQIKQALMGFDDLRNRYERLQQDAREAVAGGLPAGY